MGYLVIRMPEILRLICRESTADLRAALQEGRVSASEKIGNYSSLEWAFDWPEGVEILLEFGADPKQHFRSLVYPGAGRHSSAALLLKEGCFLSQAHLYKSVSCDDGGERLRLLVNELTARRKKLRKLAEDSLPWASISGYVGDKILDGQDCQKILGLLVEHKIPFPHPFTTQDKIEKFLMNSNGETVYHDLQNKQCAEALYLAGFLDADMLDSKGNSPLSTLAYYAYYSCSDFIEMIEWHMSKAADIHRRLPWANESVSHFLVSQIINYALFDRRDDHSSHKTKSENNLQSLITMSDVFFAPTRIPDRCNCPCSSNGCTALSVFLRELSASESWHCPQCVRGVFEKLEEWDQAYWKEPRAFIRSLTFNALDLNHTCFANTRKGYVYLRHLRPDNEDWINDNRDEQSALIEFEELVADLEQEFEKRSLPLKEFLSGPWYRRVKDHLLTRQPHEEQTIAGARSVGVELEFCGLSVPDWMEICIANKVEELSDEE
ncbi:unnamed protein product [Penicillium salamii]|uniref:Uncharacterized protein n=1 Tax=Penicillium salamii TaxID=1612424 RepID=A0A9W4N539_9EURO|nr:unnamed protein product [Penicillium salamii]CAG8289875.1 unnamed protein product [Penicillium salamii]CAG8420598.1 unnamed protein product [Penicillium salamii]CAG8421135.1 unnamed protein product [Penicillium salamii]